MIDGGGNTLDVTDLQDRDAGGSFLSCRRADDRLCRGRAPDRRADDSRRPASPARKPARLTVELLVGRRFFFSRWKGPGGWRGNVHESSCEFAAALREGAEHRKRSRDSFFRDANRQTERPPHPPPAPPPTPSESGPGGPVPPTLTGFSSASLPAFLA